MNLLHDPLIRILQPAGSTDRVSLPGLLARLGRDHVLGYPGLQKHQEDAFHVFLCYLAGAVLARAGAGDPVQDEDFWQAGLLDLAGKAGPDAWELLPPDPERPGFFQCPLPPADWQQAVRKEPLASPDALDLLPTARNHDVKRFRATAAEPDEWIFALVSLQTMSGFFGQGNYGICRMNSGFGNRVIAEIAHDMNPGPRWRLAVTRLADHRRQVLDGPLPYRPDGLVLTWTEPWDGKTQVPLSALDPFFVECCRRVRLGVDENHVIIARPLNSEAQRIACKELLGNVGDAWCPIDLSDNQPKALTIGPGGLTASILRRILFSDKIRLTALHRPADAADGPVALSVSVLVRGQGKTEGFHHRVIPVPAEIRRRLFAPAPAAGWREIAAGLSRDAITDVDTMRLKVLRPALFSLIQGGPEQLDLRDDTAEAWWHPWDARFRAAWEDAFFPWLWSVREDASREENLLAWHRVLSREALAVFDAASRAVPCPSGRRFRALARARSVFFGALHRNFPDL